LSDAPRNEPISTTLPASGMWRIAWSIARRLPERASSHPPFTLHSHAR
jgi:hypothetical protein